MIQKFFRGKRKTELKKRKDSIFQNKDSNDMVTWNKNKADNNKMKGKSEFESLKNAGMWTLRQIIK